MTIQDAIKFYKDNFDYYWNDEKYKWIAVEHFRKHWDIDSPDFAGMVMEAFSRANNLLAGGMYYAYGMLCELAKQDPEKMRSLFRTLYNEDMPLGDRLNTWWATCDEMLKVFQENAAEPQKAKNHYQDLRAVCVYLSFRYPDKYYLFKDKMYRSFKELIGYQETSRETQGSLRRYNNFSRMCDEVLEAIKADSELVKKQHEQVKADPECYPDEALHLLAQTIIYVNKDNTGETQLPTDEWYPPLSEYSPGFEKEKWLEVLNNPNVIGPVWGGTLAAFYAAGGAATCTQIGEQYHLPRSAIIGRATQLAKRIYRETNCPLYTEDGRTRYWTILFQGKNADEDMSGSYVWKLRPELYEALTEFGILRYQWKDDEAARKDDEESQYWWLNANPKIWSFANIGVGEVQSYTLYNENRNKRRIFQNFLDAKAGDMVIGYESTPVKQIVAIARISAEQDGEQLYFEKVEGLETPIDYAVLRECPELEQMEYFQNAQGSLFKLTKEEYDFILDLIRESNPVASPTSVETYTKSTFLSEVFMTEERFENLVSVLRNKKNIILQGAPGVGKTFAARRLAWSMMGEKDDNRIEFIQFHQSYSYEDFIMGYKPVEDGFELKYGVFYRFCQKAANNPEKEFFFIIDEINRGNMSKIFGELLMLIERDYRGERATLAYNGLAFSVPKNLYIIGMMNTADRSLAMIDYALRRRFSFFEMEPGFDSQGFANYQKALNSETLNRLIEKVKELNQEIARDKSLGKGFCIGHSYFCGRTNCTEEWLHAIVDYDILPMLREYWFDDNNKFQRWESILQGVFQ